ncbi:hypothetical protein IR012_00725 [Pseudomonas putida]|uniref:hypothetical protein n=1 Tax=Pseudomonas putida TaxID=303 RepID=UPI0018A89080|nr:hypothetical protein [Pseudomonas putida]MBF8668336.1 hypothetical protein [Pseudomonas putida]MBF8710845.1 hypothetical protein [Pseudomonas putida]
MQPRFVLVPAVPVDSDAIRVGVRFYAQTVSEGFDIYDNQEKTRLKQGFPTRSVGDAICDKMNAEARNPDELFPILRSE